MAGELPQSTGELIHYSDWLRRWGRNGGDQWVDRHNTYNYVEDTGPAWKTENYPVIDDAVRQEAVWDSIMQRDDNEPEVDAMAERPTWWHKIINKVAALA